MTLLAECLVVLLVFGGVTWRLVANYRTKQARSEEQYAADVKKGPGIGSAVVAIALLSFVGPAGGQYIPEVPQAEVRKAEEDDSGDGPEPGA
jgi:hypothetical protein